MRSKKSFLTLGIIVLVLFLGVGYAVVSSVYLNIGGTASVANADLKVEITNVVATTNIADKTLNFTNQLSNKNLDSNFTLNGMELNEKVTITYTVTNNETDVDAEIKLASGVELTNSNADFFDVNYAIPDSVTDLASGDKTMEVVVTVELVQTPVTEEEGTTTVGLKLAAIPKGGSENSGSSTVITSPVKFGEKYYAVSGNGLDIKSSAIWIIFNEDGTLTQIENGVDFPEDGYSYYESSIIHSTMSETEQFTISSDGKYLSLVFDSNVYLSFVHESEYFNISTFSIKYGQNYLCTLDNVNTISKVDSSIIFYPDGSALEINADGTINKMERGSFIYTKKELLSSEIPDVVKVYVSEEGRSISFVYNEQIVMSYSLETQLPISWNTLEVASNESVLLDSSYMDDTTITNSKFVKVSSVSPFALYFYDSSVYVEGEVDTFVFESISESTDSNNGATSHLIKYSNSSSNIYVMIIVTSGEFFGIEFSGPGIYALDMSGENQDVDLDIKIDYTIH